MNDRAKRRLAMARALLALDPHITPNQILDAIRTKESPEQQDLKRIVDWLEDYEKHENEFLWGQ